MLGRMSFRISCNTDSEQDSDLEAEFLASSIWDQERGQVQNQEEEHWRNEIGNVEDWPPSHRDLCNKI